MIICKSMNHSYEYDCFISHAFEDKDIFVRELAIKLQQKGLMVWYDEFTLKIGNSLSAAIDKGIASSKCGIVVLSHNFFNKYWTQEELNRLAIKRSKTGMDIILPIWLNISHDEIYKYSPMLADIYAIKSENGIDYVCNEIEKAINNIAHF